MCGICGIVDASHELPVTPERLRAMTDSIVHRGPDEQGEYLESGVALGMRRLSIIDVAGGHQPVRNEDASVVAVFNGEIYNFRELQRDLRARGHELRSPGDSEVIVHLYEEFGFSFLDRIRGMFAIALWDATHRRLLLARDRMGVKPLYWTRAGRRLGFASEVKSLIAGGIVTPRLDLDAARLFLSLGYVPSPFTLFEGVYKLPSATWLEWRDGELAGPKHYWFPETPTQVAVEDWDGDARNLLELMRRSVRAQMVSEVPIGVMLSGGIDSSLITALMAETTDRVQTFSVAFEGSSSANELEWARTVAKRFDTNHHEEMLSVDAVWALLDEAMWHLEEPVADLSFLGLLVLSRLARRDVTVALCGQAADELLGGYNKHLIARIAPVLPPLLATLADRIVTSRERPPVLRALEALCAASDVERLLALSRLGTTRSVASILPGMAPSQVGEQLTRALAPSAAASAARSPLSRILSMDVRLALPDLMFTYFDKMSMATSLEIRVPFADEDVVNYCMALPDDRRIRGRRGKALLRAASRGLVDDAILARPKRGFLRGAVGSWATQAQSAMRTVLSDDRTRGRGIYDNRAVEQLVSTVGQGARSGEQLLALFLLEQWARIFVDGDAPR